MNPSIGFRSSLATDAGPVRPLNTDSVETREPAGSLERARKGAIWVIADGVGSDENSQRASRLAARTVVDAYWHSAIPEVDARLRAAVERANSMLLAERPSGGGTREERFGATVLAAVIIQDDLYIAHAGRSRAYVFRGGSLRQLTEDHTWVAREIRAGRLSPEDAATHPRRNAITRALGIREPVDVDLVAERLEPDDLVLLCSDGFHRQVAETDVVATLQRYGSDAASVLVEAAAQRGGEDNITAVTIATGAQPDVTDATLDRVVLLNRLGTELTGSLDLDATLQSVLEHLLVLSGGERAAILLREPEGRLTPYLSHNLWSGGIPDPSRTVAEQAVQEQQPILVQNALDDPRFRTSESIVTSSLQSILCVPLIVNQDAIGVLYVDATTGDSMTVSQTDLELLVSFAGHAAAAIQSARLHETLLSRTREVELAGIRQDALIRSLSSGLIALDNQGVISEWNPAAEAILGIRADTALGSTLAETLPSPVARWLTNLSLQAEQEDQTIFVGDEWEGSVGERPRVILAGRVARIRDRDGRVTGTVFVVIDRTDLVSMEESRQAEIAERERLRSLFSRYLAPSLVERLLSSPDAVQLGGNRKDVTILFADIRGFTGFSEREAPEAVVEILNQYLELATGEIFNQLGTLDKFLGDGIMALFGAPLDVPDHELAAVRAAIAMRSRLEDYRRETGARVGVGVGLNSGEAIVGNIGTPELMSYTAIGDVVNVAARLESEARPGEILIGETTFERIADRIEVEELGPLHVKGRAVPVPTYKVHRVLDDTADA